MGGRYVKSYDNKNKFHIDSNNLYGWAMSEDLLYDGKKFVKKVKLEDKVNSSDDIEFGR